jgi:hypothetical protein
VKKWVELNIVTENVGSRANKSDHRPFHGSNFEVDTEARILATIHDCYDCDIDYRRGMKLTGPYSPPSQHDPRHWPRPTRKDRKRSCPQISRSRCSTRARPGSVKWDSGVGISQSVQSVLFRYRTIRLRKWEPGKKGILTFFERR